MENRGKIAKINRDLRESGMIDNACNNGLLGDRALLLLLEPTLPKEFDFYG